MNTAASRTPMGPLLDEDLVRLLLSQFDGGTEADRVVTCPWDANAELASVPVHSDDELEAITARARRAQRAWAQTDVAHRCSVMRRFSSLVMQHRDRILDVIQAETGKSRVHALEEVLDVALTAGYYAGLAPRTLRPRSTPGAMPLLTSTEVRLHPKGLVGIISPWNYPFTLAVSDAVPALLAGNAVVLKPDSGTPLSAALSVWLLREAGLPRDVMQLVSGPGSRIGGGLIDASDYVMFTGSSETGRTIAAQCGQRLIGCSAELGGKNPMLVLADANVEAAARGAVRGCFSNTGQLCVSIERIYVDRSVYPAFLDAFVKATEELQLGPGFDWNVDIGSLISEDHLATVQAHLHDAVHKGAVVRCGGRARPDLGPAFFEPTILTEVPAEADLARAETFGPVVSVYPVDGEEEAIRLANDTDFGLNASVWTSQRRANEVAAKVQAGTVNVNEGYSATWGSHAAEMGGWKTSGLGRRHGVSGLTKYTEPQTISRQYLRPIGPWPEISNERYAWLMSQATKVLARFR